MRRRLSCCFAAIVLATVLAGCRNSGEHASSPPALEGPKEVVALYNARCISCHASDLSGKVGPDSDLRTVGSRMSKEQLAEQIANGGDIMPPFKDKLSAEQIDTLADWLAERQ